MARSLTLALAVLCGCPGGSSDPPRLKGLGAPCASRGECESGLCLAGVCAATLPPAASCPAVPATPQLRADPAVVEAPDPGPTLCVSTVRESVLPAEMVEDLGELQVGADATFVVTPGTASFVIFSQEAGNTAADAVLVGSLEIANAVVPTNVAAPGGTVYYDDLADWPRIRLGPFAYPEFSQLLAHDLGLQTVSGAFPVPNTSAAIDRIHTAGEVTPGDWTFRVNDWAWQCPFTGCAGGNGAGRYRLHAVKRPGPLASTGTLDLEVYLVTDPTSPLPTAAIAAAHPQVERWVRSIGAFLGNAGLCVGEVTFHDVPQWAKDRYAPNGEVDLADGSVCGDLGQLFTTAIVPKRAVHLFLSDGFLPGESRTAGIDGSIPGPSGFPGTINGGAIVALNDELGQPPGAGPCTAADVNLGCGTDRLAYIAAHEIGHWLGLYHTTEAVGIFFDPVADTGRCPCFSCAPAPLRNRCAEVSPDPTTLVANGSCTASESCGGGRNLMFWLVDGDVSTGELSPDQGRIMRLNPAVR